MEIKKLVFIPIVLFVFSLMVLFYNYFVTGDFILRDIDLKGGTLLTIDSNTPIDASTLEDHLLKKYDSVLISNLRTPTGYGVSIQVESKVNTTELLNDVKKFGISVETFSVETIGPTLGHLFLWQVVYVLIVAFILMSIVTFVIYRNLVSSFGIVFATLANILTILAITSLLGIRVSFAGFAGLLMLIAYTVDTNIVLTNKVLKSTPEEFGKQYKRALITGVTLIVSITTTMMVAMFLSSSKLLINISQILVIGFVSDLLFTWVFNAGILEYWIERRYK